MCYTMVPRCRRSCCRISIIDSRSQIFVRAVVQGRPVSPTSHVEATCRLGNWQLEADARLDFNARALTNSTALHLPGILNSTGYCCFVFQSAQTP